MLAKLASFTLVGIEAVTVEVEVDISFTSMPKTVLVGLAEAAVRESTHRVERALVNSGYRRPIDRIVINLAPADLKKEASGFDLPIALGMLVGSGQAAIERPGRYAVVGELALTGETRPIKGVLAMALAAAHEKFDGLLVPEANASEAAVVEGIPVYPISSLAEAVGFLSGQLEIDPRSVDLEEVFRRLTRGEEDFVDVKGQDYAKRALVIAAAGGHNVLMIGPPGTGKTLLAKRLGTIMPSLTPSESLETTRIYSAMGLLRAGEPLMAVRPFRSPHHSVSDAGLVGGGSTPQPGEISLAHKGVLFLDELPEFNRKTLEVLRQPLEEGHVTISRALRSTTFPADFVLVAAMNPCPCGYRSDPRRACNCTPPQVEKYLSKISGPLLDRIDLHVEVPAVPFTQLTEAPPGPTSAEFLNQVLKARTLQAQRFGNKGPIVNGRMTPRQVRKFCPLRPEALSLLKAAMEELGLSARAHDKVLRVARTMADLEESEIILPQHIAEAVGYRSLDRSVWA
ncbi:YifB family Mg chelatase-like AAA ATPase [Singulisphaera acidiphila]|uniref:Mg chelatase-related protein n=1 Tax=Singulisphaera acidiphila (strain ATCC BAA-1392 / DSM 18658 / VKM B-2454 / MOB10) TaxID=886293 RepID=L0DFH7_SINAD|nr:YifB family Mg chelatase-like AAA ATPase [Singulisphaera acidiphila]AGA27615.1 Mg chelatase-related protein [Singulisphaera acidiphila DSM 18658]